jgi:hypothetical protein
MLKVTIKRHTDFDATLAVEEDVVGFDVAVDDALIVKMAEALACLWSV